jgi:predicted lactoylglutathione lyase
MSSLYVRGEGACTGHPSRRVDELAERAVTAGAYDGGGQDLGYLYMRAFRDLDGHRWSFRHFVQSA